ncbi:unnamed protein product [Discula destructiva]
MTVDSVTKLEGYQTINEGSLSDRRLEDDPLEPLAIVGFSFKYPQDADTTEGLWTILKEKRDVMTEWPKDRINLEAFFYKDEGQEQNKFVRGAHFVKEDLGTFDATFFGISATEAMAMDIQQRKLLEITYHALESAGISMEEVYGSKTGVYSGSMADDYQQMLFKDVDDMPKYAASGAAKTMLANRISWFYNLHGPSFSLDSACSSSLTAFDFACQGLRNGDCEMGIVTGSSLVFAPDGTLGLIKLSMLSTDGRCFSFDDRANGYSRGEGFGVVLVKRLSDAVRDNDVIRAVVRSTGSNQDGRTPGVTQPSTKMQAALIRETYQKAGLDFNETRFFEAHGTGTPLGDPIEAAAIGSVFRTARSPDEPLYVGALKSNLGHLEGGSGVASLIKTILVLESGIIPPNANFENINPRIDADFHNLRFPTQSIPWPCSGLRRASIASFGFGGSNSHVILDDAYSYLLSRGLEGHHNTSPRVPEASQIRSTQQNGLPNGINTVPKHRCDTESNAKTWFKTTSGGSSSEPGILVPNPRDNSDKLLVFSASDESGIKRLAETYASYFESHLPKDEKEQRQLLDSFAYTLCERRSRLPWKSFAVVNSAEMLTNLEDHVSKPVMAEPNAKAVFIFTGQGAQYRNMGVDLLQNPTFRSTIELFDEELAKLECTWSVADVLSRHDSSTDIDDPVYSQTMTTALQIALYELMKTLGVQAALVAGHSSGEIAAAYAAGALNLASACRVSYFRGKCASALRSQSIANPGAMMSVDLSAQEMQHYVQGSVGNQQSTLHIACINSPTNVTISGDEAAIDAIEVTLAAQNVYTRKLNTGVAYHSPYMKDAARTYAEELAHLERGAKSGTRATLISSVSGDYVHDLDMLCTADYWVANLMSPVQFSRVMSLVSSVMGKKKTRKLGKPRLDVKDIIEIGPHAALRRPILACLEHNGVPESKTRYHSVLFRHTPSTSTILKLIGELYSSNYPVKVHKAVEIGNVFPESPKLLVDLPSYPFNHSRSYWYESAISKHSRLRAPQHELLGIPVADWNPLEPRWRKVFDCTEMPWIAHHQVNDTIIYPAAGMVAMAIQGSSQIADPTRRVSAYEIRDAVFTAPITIRKTETSEIQMHMRLDRNHKDKNSTSLDFRVYSASATGWFQNSSGNVQILYETEQSEATQALQVRENLFFQQRYAEALRKCALDVPKTKLYDQLRSNGLHYGPTFQPLDGLAWDGDSTCVGSIQCFDGNPEFSQHGLQPHVVHPTVLDGAGQLPWLCLTKGGDEVVINGAAVTRIRYAWVASSGLSYPETTHIQACAVAGLKGLRSTDSSMFALGPAGNLVLRISHMETTAVGGDESSSIARIPRDLCFGMAYKPDVAFLDQDQLLALTNAKLESAKPPTRFYEDLELVIFYFVVNTLKECEPFLARNEFPKPHIAKYASWLSRQVQKYHSGQLPHSRPDWIDRIQDTSEMECLMKSLENASPEGGLYVQVGRNLVSVVRGLKDPLEVLFENGHAGRHYQAMCDHILCCKKLVSYLDLLAHKFPQLKILEVGAGTGSFTEHMLRGLGKHFERYDYTDISASFFKEGREKFSEFKRKMDFKVLNIEEDPIDQGYELESYDVIVAGWVLHATKDLASTIRHVRKLLKPGGKLILLEITESEILRNGFAFGTLPGWWLSTEPSREWSPCVSEIEWQRLLEDNGFRSPDIILPDYEGDISHEHSIIVATAAEHSDSRTQGAPADITLIVDSQSPLQQALAHRLQGHIEQRNGKRCAILSLEDELLTQMSHTSLVFLAELDRPYLSNLDDSKFSFLQHLLRQASMVTWVTHANTADVSKPHLQMVRGLARVLFVEKPALGFVTLSFEDPEFDLETCSNYIHRVVAMHTAGPSHLRELEYVVRDSFITINRVFDSEAMNQEIFSKTNAMIRPRSLQQGVPMVLTIPQSGLLDSIRWEKDSTCGEDLDDDDIEIEVQAMGVNFRDLLIVLGKYSAVTVGCECAGIVSRVGANCKTLQPGDRVCALAIGCSNTHARFNYQLAVEIPDFLSSAEAASLPCTGVTAYHSLVTLAGLQKEDSILIHCASGGTGQMALQIAQYIGAEVYVTVGSEEKRQLLKDIYGVPDDHIFHSRDTSFARDISRATNGRGVDVVLNSLSGEGLLASWECIAPFGRFLELGKMDIEENSGLPMAQFAKNVSFHAIAMDHFSLQKPLATARALQAVIDMVGKGTMKVAAPLNVEPISDLEAVLRKMQSGTNVGKSVLTFSPTDVVRTWWEPGFSCVLDPKSTYLIAGGFGGLGRSAARWMVQRGARNLILLSRSGPTSGAAHKLVKDLQDEGVTIRMPRCDVSDSKSLAAALATCSDLPDINGCLQATMVLQDSLFETMTWNQWSVSCRSKVQSTWNLHTQLPSGMSFFVMLSSIAGIAGSMGQSNYAAGNTFQDGMAAHRLALGEKAVSIDLGWMSDIGAIAEDASITGGKGYGTLAPVYANELLALLDHYCDPKLQIHEAQQAQPMIGLVSPARFRSLGLEPPEWLLDRPLFRSMMQKNDELESSNVDSGARDSEHDWASELLQSSSNANATSIVVEALVQRLSKATATPPEEISHTRPLHVYGVDSLLAVELRNWFSKVFQADVAIFDITGSGTLEQVAKGALSSSMLLKQVKWAKEDHEAR